MVQLRQVQQAQYPALYLGQSGGKGRRIMVQLRQVQQAQYPALYLGQPGGKGRI